MLPKNQLFYTKKIKFLTKISDHTVTLDASFSEAPIPRCSTKLLVFKIFAKTTENTCTGVPVLIKLHASRLELY